MRKTVLSSALVLVLFLGEATVFWAVAQEKTSPTKMLTATGTISKLQATDHRLTVLVSDGSTARFSWTAETKINGTLSQGAKVTIRYTTLPDGQNLAHQISVGR